LLLDIVLGAEAQNERTRASRGLPLERQDRLAAIGPGLVLVFRWWAAEQALCQAVWRNGTAALRAAQSPMV